MFLKLSFGILLDLFIVVVFGQENNSVPVRKCCLENEVKYEFFEINNSVTIFN